MPNTELRTNVIITPYHCDGCQRTFESGPFQLAQKAHPSESEAQARRRLIDASPARES